MEEPFLSCIFVAEATGISRTTLRRIEDGVTDGIDFDTLAKLCSYYGVGVGEVLEFEANNRAAQEEGPMIDAAAAG